MADLNQFKTNNAYLLLALDHRGSFLKMINPESPATVTDEEAAAVKVDILKACQSTMGGVLLDPDFGLQAYKQVFVTDPKPALIMSTELTGYEDTNKGRQTQIEYQALELVQFGAQAAKLLIYYHPQADNRADQINVARQVLEDAHTQDLPLFLEPVFYEYNSQAVNFEVDTLTSLQQFLDAGVRPDVFKIAYPGSPDACNQVTQLLGDIPWIILTAGKDFDTFVQQLQIAVENGCQGFLAGRALWQDLFQLQGEDRTNFLTQTLPSRFQQISEIASK